MAGDRINLQCDMWWDKPNAPSTNNIGSQVLNALLPLLAGSVPGVSGGHIETGQTGSGGSFFSPSISGFLGNQPAAGSVPQAGVNWILLDEQFGWQAGNGSGTEPVDPNGNYYHFVKGCNDAVEVQKSGYIYIYTSNQSNIDVYFDNLQVSMVHGPLLEETHYYPFGLTMQGISSKAANKLENRHKFNDGTELTTDLDLSTYETPFRQYDPQLGRFNRIDPMSESFEDWTPYNYSVNNPILLNDPTGLTPGFPGDVRDETTLPTVVVRPSVRHMSAQGIEALHARQQYTQDANGDRHSIDNPNYDWRTRQAMKNWDHFQNERRHFNDAVDGVVQEGIWLAIPWGRALRGVGWAYRAAKGSQILKIAGRYAPKLFEETAKEVLANRGDLSKIDISDIVVSTVSSKFNVFGKIGAEVFNAASDASVHDGFQNIINKRKNIINAAVDLGFSFGKQQVGDFMGSGVPNAQNAKDVIIDQFKNIVKAQTGIAPL